MIAFKVKLPDGEYRLLTRMAYKLYASVHQATHGRQPEHELVTTSPYASVVSIVDLLTSTHTKGEYKL